MLVFHSCKIAGADVAGATYDGEYTEDPKTHEVSYQAMIAAPAGVVPVQTGIPLVAPITITLSGKLRQEDVESGKPVLLQTQIGPLNIIFRKIRNLP